MVGGAEWWLMNPEHWPEFYWIFNLKIQVVVLNWHFWEMDSSSEVLFQGILGENFTVCIKISHLPKQKNHVKLIPNKHIPRSLSLGLFHVVKS
jgi:hypothetical protein